MNGLIYDVGRELFLKLDDGGSRRHKKKLYKRRFGLNVRKYFSNRIVDQSQSEEFVKANSINTFKKYIILGTRTNSLYGVFEIV